MIERKKTIPGETRKKESSSKSLNDVKKSIRCSPVTRRSFWSTRTSFWSTRTTFWTTRMTFWLTRTSLVGQNRSGRPERRSGRPEQRSVQPERRSGRPERRSGRLNDFIVCISYYFLMFFTLAKKTHPSPASGSVDPKSVE